MGPHREATLELATLIGAKVFVETGTYKGKTTRWAAEEFDFVHTIEAAQPFYDRYHAELKALGNIEPHFGDSREHLPRVVEKIGDQPAMFWLDGHWSGGVTAGELDECPIIEELDAIKHRRNDVIMIDDARLFLAAPPMPFDADQWPNVFDIALSLGEHLPHYFVEIFHDTIFMAPQQASIKNCLRIWARKHAQAIGRGDTG